MLVLRIIYVLRQTERSSMIIGLKFFNSVYIFFHSDVEKQPGVEKDSLGNLRKQIEEAQKQSGRLIEAQLGLEYFPVLSPVSRYFWFTLIMKEFYSSPPTSTVSIKELKAWIAFLFKFFHKLSAKLLKLRLSDTDDYFKIYQACSCYNISLSKTYETNFQLFSF